MVHQETQVFRESIPPRMKGQSFKRKGLPSFFFLCRSRTGCLKVQQQPLCNYEEESHTMRTESSRAGKRQWTQGSCCLGEKPSLDEAEAMEDGLGGTGLEMIARERSRERRF